MSAWPRTILNWAAVTLLFGLGVVAGLGYWGWQAAHTPGSYELTQPFVVQKGDSGDDIIMNLARQGVVQHPQILRLWARIQMRLQPVEAIHAGEYALPAAQNMLQIWAYLQSGQVVQYSLTVPEGLTVQQVAKLLRNKPELTGDLADADLPPEGSLWPETYTFQRGQSRLALLQQMQQPQKEWLAREWPRRAKNLPIKTPAQAVVLASIVEKETGVPHERVRIAGVFHNRLRANMPLQSDPTVVYVVTNGLGDMQGKRLLRKHLATPSPINTYQVAGLPPQPIANPGQAALKAVLHPEENNYYYFVADGTGGHVFSRNLQQHNQRVQQWRQIRRQKEQAQ